MFQECIGEFDFRTPLSWCNFYCYVQFFSQQLSITSRQRFMTHRSSRILSSSLPPREYSPRFEDSSPGMRNSSKDYELVVEFELRREKEKSLILEERLRNKEGFIRQMKEFQDELTVAFEKCQQELQFYKAECENYEVKYQSYSTFNQNRHNKEKTALSNQERESLEHDIRNYVEEIVQLKHLVIRLEEEINFYESKVGNSARKRCNSQSPKKQKIISNSPLGQNQHFDFEIQGQADRKMQKGRRVQDQNSHQNAPANKVRSKTQANDFSKGNRMDIESSVELLEEIVREKRKVGSFLNHFLTMAEFFRPEIKQGNLKQRLKKAWKWIKSVVVDWNHLSKGNIQQSKFYQLGQTIFSLLPINCSMQEAVERVKNNHQSFN